MIKRILIPLDPSPFSKKALATAIEMAKVHHAEVTGLVVLDIPGIEKSIGSIPAGAAHYARELEKSKVEAAHKRINILMQKFRNSCKEAGIKFEEHERQGIPSDKILEEAKFYDLLVIGSKTFFHFESQDEPGDSFSEILDEAVTPLLAVPESLKIPSADNGPFNALICFDGEKPSCRALQRFAQVGWPDALDIRVKILMSHDYNKLASHYLNDAEKYLRAHGFKDVETVYTSKNIIKYVDDNMMDWPDIFVIGAHSSKGILDFMAGSLMKYLVKEAKKPIFIGQ